MKYLITGYNGQLGFDIKRELLKRGVSEENILATDVKEMDITNREEVMKVIGEFNPDVIFHCAAWTQVDKAEGFEFDDIEDEVEREKKKSDFNELINKINVLGTKNITDASIKVNAKLFYMSTDYVFDGTKEGLYTEEDAVNPLSVYGKTKYLGEEEVRKNPNHFITRISWVFGINGNNFIKTMLNLSDKYEEISVVDDQVGSPTYTVDLSKLLVDMAYTDNYGTYHVNNDGYCSWAEFAEEIFKVNGKDVKVNHVSTEEYSKGKKQAYRPLNSKLSKEKLISNGYEMLPTWQDAVKRYSKELKLSNK